MAFFVQILLVIIFVFFFFQAEDGIRDADVTGVQTCALPICRGVALYYRDGDGHLVTYAALPAPGLTMPESRRVAIENRWRPALMSDSGFSAWVWRQGALGCFIVADMVSASDVERLK